MLIGFYLGWALLVCAFAAAAAESLVYSLPHDNSWLVSAYDLWFTFRPGSLVVTQIQIEKISPLLWDPLIVTVLAPPAWASLGVIGISLAWGCWPGRKMTETQQEELHRLEEAMFLYDKLGRDASDNGYAADGDDMSPSLADYQAMEKMSEDEALSDERLLAEISEMAAEFEREKEDKDHNKP